jgi:hypothetical protein
MTPGATPGRMPLACLALTLAIAIAPAIDAAGHSPTSVDGRAPVVILYGDSLAWEAEEHFLAAIAEGTDATAVGRTFGGTAICDFMDLMKDDAVSLRPAAVVLEFSGNRFTACMHHADGTGMGDGDAFMKYLTDATEAVGIFTSVGTHVYLAGAPVSRPVLGAFRRGRALNVMYSWVALRSPVGTVSYIDAGTAVQDGDEYVDELPCLPDERCPEGDTTVVRSSDGVHLCPGDDSRRDPVTARCLVWSSGAYRYGRAMAAPVRSQLLMESARRR